MPERFGFPFNQRLWRPLRADGALLAPRTGPPVTIFGRLAPGATLRQAEAELQAITAGQAATAPDAYRNLQPRVVGYGTPPLEGDTPVITNVLYAANAFFLLVLGVISTNVATLVFARTATRGWEVAVRNALGSAVVAGRNFSPLDVDRGHVVIVNQSFSRLVLGDRNPVGQRVGITHCEEDGVAADDGWYGVVGWAATRFVASARSAARPGVPP